MTPIAEDAIEQTTLQWLENLGCGVAYGPDIAFDGPFPERDEEANYTDIVLMGRLRSALECINASLLTDRAAEVKISDLRSQHSGL